MPQTVGAGRSSSYGTVAAPESEFANKFPQLASRTYEVSNLDLDKTLEGADLVPVHECSDRGLVRRIAVVQTLAVPV